MWLQNKRRSLLRDSAAARSWIYIPVSAPFFWKRLVERVAVGLCSITEGDTKERMEGVYPTGSLCLFLSHKQIFILPACPVSSLSFSFTLIQPNLLSGPSLLYSPMIICVCLSLVFDFASTFSSFYFQERLGHPDIGLSQGSSALTDRPHPEMWKLIWPHKHRYKIMLMMTRMWGVIWGKPCLPSGTCRGEKWTCVDFLGCLFAGAFLWDPALP